MKLLYYKTHWPTLKEFDCRIQTQKCVAGHVHVSLYHYKVDTYDIAGRYSLLCAIQTGGGGTFEDE